MKWTDTQEIAISLAETHPDKDPKAVHLVDLNTSLLAWPGSSDDPKRSGDNILEAIQQAWIEEAE